MAEDSRRCEQAPYDPVEPVPPRTHHAVYVTLPWNATEAVGAHARDGFVDKDHSTARRITIEGDTSVVLPLLVAELPE